MSVFTCVSSNIMLGNSNGHGFLVATNEETLAAGSPESGHDGFGFSQAWWPAELRKRTKSSGRIVSLGRRRLFGDAVRQLARPLLLFATAVLALGCKTSLHAPNLNNLYDRSAQHHDPWRNPIIVIPGLLGSKLVEPQSAQIVWGAFGGGAANPRRPADARLIALPMQSDLPLRDLVDEVVSDGALDRIKIKLLGLPIELDAYFFIMASLGVGGYRDELLGRLGEINYGQDHYTCFQFDYDWRRDNVENAQRLYQFMEEKRAYIREQIKRRYGVDNPDVKFDIVSHSMGGILLRYMLEFGDSDLPADGSIPAVTWAGAEFVDRAILVSPPNSGSLLAVEQMIQGVQFSALFPRYQPALIGTFPSVYQLLPRARHGSVVDRATGAALDPLDPDFWIQNGWGLADPKQDEALKVLLPQAADAVERRGIAIDHLKKSLARARQFQTALDQPATAPPNGTELYLIAGDAVLTDATLTVDRANGSYEITTRSPGDGTILRASALMDERLGGDWTPELKSPIPWRNVQFVFEDHLGITSNHEFTDNLLYLLLESQRRQMTQTRPVASEALTAALTQRHVPRRDSKRWTGTRFTTPVALGTSTGGTN